MTHLLKALCFLGGIDTHAVVLNPLMSTCITPDPEARAVTRVQFAGITQAGLKRSAGRRTIALLTDGYVVY